MRNKQNKKHPTAKSDVATSVLEQNAHFVRENASAAAQNIDCAQCEHLQTTSTQIEQKSDSAFACEISEKDERFEKQSAAQSTRCQQNEQPQIENHGENAASDCETSAKGEQPFASKSAKSKKTQKQNAKMARKQRKQELKTERASKRTLPQLDEKTLLANKLSALARQQKDIKNWFKLDNAALMYPLVARKESISVFRLAVQLAEPVQPVVLQLAVNDVIARFPSICGCVKNGFFWPYIDRPVVPVVAKEQTKVPGRPMPVDSRRSQIRVNYFQNQIAVEFFHSATDGTGGLTFLNSLLRCYFARLGIDCEKRNCLDHRDTPTVAEFRDNFANIAVTKNPPPCPAVVKSKKLRGTPLKNKKYVTVKGICSASELHALAKMHNATVTEFLCAVQLLALNHLCQVTGNKDERPIRVLVPVNLRKRYNVETIRNFSSYIFFQYNGQTELDEVLADITKQRDEQLTDDYFRGMVSFNYNSGNNPLLKIVPLAVKRLVLKAIVMGRGDGIVNCSTFSNLGKVDAPKEFAQNVLRYEFTLGKPAKNTNNFTAATFGDVCVIAVTNAFLERDCERFFFSTLANMGLHLALESDVWGNEE